MPIVDSVHKETSHDEHDRTALRHRPDLRRDRAGLDYRRQRDPGAPGTQSGREPGATDPSGPHGGNQVAVFTRLATFLHANARRVHAVAVLAAAVAGAF